MRNIKFNFWLKTIFYINILFKKFKINLKIIIILKYFYLDIKY